MSSGRARTPWWLLALGACLLIGAVLVAIDALPYLIASRGPSPSIGSHSAAWNRFELAGLALLGAVASVLEYRKRTMAESRALSSSRNQLSLSTSRRLIWGVTLLGVVLQAWLIFARWCPASVQLERLSVATGDGLSSLHGEAKCWARFLSSAAILLALGFGAELIASRRARRERHGRGA